MTMALEIFSDYIMYEHDVVVVVLLILTSPSCRCVLLLHYCHRQKNRQQGMVKRLGVGCSVGVLGSTGGVGEGCGSVGVLS